MLPVGLYDWKTTTAHPILTFMLKNILRTFEAEILKVFKNVQPQPQIRRSYTRKECTAAAFGVWRLQIMAVFLLETDNPSAILRLKYKYGTNYDKY